MTVEIVPGKLRYCGQMCRALRVDHVYALMQRNVPIHHELRAMFSRSFYTRAAFLNGHLAAMWGAEGSPLSSTAFLWMALAQFAVRYPVTVLRHARREIDGLARNKHALVTTVIPEDAAAMRLAKFLGFREAGEPDDRVQAGGVLQVGLIRRVQ